MAEALGLTGIRVTAPGELDEAVRKALALPGPVLLDVLTNPSEVAVPERPTMSQAWGFAIAKIKENLPSGAR